MRGQLGLRPGVSQVVQVEVLPVAVGVRRNKAEAIEVRAPGLMFVGQRQHSAFAVEGNSDAAFSAGARGRLFQRPVVRGAVWINVRTALAGFPLGVVQAVSGRKHKTFTARSADSDTKKIRRCANGV